MEHALAEQGFDKGPLKNQIKAARNEGLVTERMEEWLLAVREVGNMATHEAAGTKEDAELTLDVCEQVLKDLYETPLRLAERRKALGEQTAGEDGS